MKEEEIRPKKIFDEYLRLTKKDSSIYFSNVDLSYINCPACGGDGENAFLKHNFNYQICPDCDTLFVNPRPVAEAFSKYYTESPSSKFWATTFYKETAESRREKLWKPKAKIVLDILERNFASNHTLIDIGGGFGLFAEEIREISGRVPVIIEPGPYLAVACREKSLPVIQKFLEDITPDDLPEGPRAFISFELFEHLHSPELFLKHLLGLMNSGDLFIFTTLSGLGVDIQALWENSKSVSPPHHLNFFNPRSIRLILSKLGFEGIQVTTPGKIDIDILINNQSLIKDRFWKTFISNVNDSDKKLWQELISNTGWSSHMMVVCSKF